MNYQETLDYLYAQVPMFQNLGAGAYKPGLDTTLALAGHFGNPHLSLPRCIHIGGTNGKGSTSHTIAAILQEAGYKVGLYTSPHLLDFRERIRINGTTVSKEFVTDFVEEYRRKPELVALHPTFFELTTVMALKYFVEQNVDIAVIEVGLGGRLDCTNIITPVLSIITNISLDHTALLGHTEAEIAREKAGIIKPGIPVVIGRADGDVRKVFERKAAEYGSTIAFAQDATHYSDVIITDDHIDYIGTERGTIRGELCGACQIENAATILTSLPYIEDDLGVKFTDTVVAKAFATVCESTGLMGRWMEIQKEPVRVICDTGHNIGGWQHLGPSLQRIADSGSLHMVLGFVSDKDIDSIVNLFPCNARYYFARPSVERGREAQSTAASAASHGVFGDAYHTVRQAFDAARGVAAPGDTIFVGGSTFVVADLLAYLQK